MRGGELFDEIAARGKHSEDETRNFMVQALLAVQHMHSKHIMHRDLKPENLLMSSKSVGMWNMWA